MLMMMGKINIFEKYGHCYFMIGHSDTWSERKIKSYYEEMGINIAD